MNERDSLKHQIYFDNSFKQVGIKELKSELVKTRDDLMREQKSSKEKSKKLEEVFDTNKFE